MGICILFKCAAFVPLRLGCSRCSVQSFDPGRGRKGGSLGQLRTFDETTESHARLRQLNALAELVPVGIIALDRQLQCSFVNARWSDLSGLNNDESLSDDWLDAVLPDDREEFLESLVNKATEEKDVAVDVRLRTPLGRVTWVKFEGRAQFNFRGNFDGFVATVTDVSEHIETQQHLHDRANYDLVSQLPNRNYLEEQLEASLAKCATDRGLALLFIDLDDFKIVNDTYGHKAGDEVIRIAAQRMRGMLRAGDVVARVGGDEFAVLLSSVRSADDAGMVADKLISTLSETIRLQEARVKIGASIGIAIADDPDMTATLLLHLADRAMYNAKRMGKNRYRFASGASESVEVGRAELRADLERAVRDDELRLHYQPQFNAVDVGLRGCEALLRWTHREHGSIPPRRFIPLLEDLDLMTSVTGWILRRAAEDLAAWRDMGLVDDDFTMAINVQGDLFSAPYAVEMILETIRSAAIPNESICIEITETAIIRDEGGCISAVEQLRVAGVKTSLDDFGTGYSSLNHLRQFRVDSVKIDRSFLKTVIDSAADRDVTRLIVQLARRLGLSVVAEGVDSQEKYNVLRDLGCDGMQGFLFGEPVGEAKFREWLSDLEPEMPNPKAERQLAYAGYS